MKELNKRVKILIADDHPLFLKGLREIIGEEEEWIVVGEAHDGQQAIDQIVKSHPDIAILDINMPHKDGLEVAKFVHEEQLPTTLIILTMYDDALLFNRAASYGVKGFVLKESAIDDIVECIGNVAEGKSFVSQKLTSQMLNGSPKPNQILNSLKFKLTATEQKVIRLISEDMTTKVIAEKLFISPKTVEHHRSNICRKLKLTGKNALLRYVLENKETLLKTLHDV